METRKLHVCGPHLSSICQLGTWRGKHFQSLPTGCTIHPRVSEHRRHCGVVIIIQNHAVAEPDAGVTWGCSQALDEDRRGADNLKRGRLGRDRERREGRGKGSPPQTLLHPPCVGRRCNLTSTPRSAAPLPGPQLQPHRAPGSLRMRFSFKPVSQDRTSPRHSFSRGPAPAGGGGLLFTPTESRVWNDPTICNL